MITLCSLKHLAKSGNASSAISEDAFVNAENKRFFEEKNTLQKNIEKLDIKEVLQAIKATNRYCTWGDIQFFNKSMQGGNCQKRLDAIKVFPMLTRHLRHRRYLFVIR